MVRTFSVPYICFDIQSIGTLLNHEKECSIYILMLDWLNILVYSNSKETIIRSHLVRKKGMKLEFSEGVNGIRMEFSRDSIWTNAHERNIIQSVWRLPI